MKKAAAFIIALALIIAAFAIYSAREDALEAGAFGARAKSVTVMDMMRGLAGE